MLPRGKNAAPNTPSPTRKLVLIIVFILIGIAFYLFPEKTTQNYAEMPQACAGCANECKINVCINWDAPGENGCVATPPNIGCCVAYEMQCDPNCEPPPPPPSPPSINGTLNCSAWGANSWCIGNETLDLSATEYQGKLILISGDLNASLFTCTPATLGTAFCAIPLPEGTGIANYLATSEYGTDTGTSNWQRDTVARSISGQMSGTTGANGWFISAVELRASASDSTSALATFQHSPNNAIWTNYTAPLNFSDGTHSIYFRATDNAGNVENFSQEIKIDSQNPQLSQQINGTLGANGWYISNVIVENAQSDSAPSSGIQFFDTSFDGANWDAYSAPINLSDGVYVLQSRVIDNAGNQAQNAVAINIDTIPPTISGTLVGQLGAGNWYISSVQAKVAVSDATSGVALTEYSANGGAWENYTTPVNFEDGTHQIQFRTTDTAGLVAETQIFDFKIDSSAPEIHLPSRWYIWESGTFTIKDSGSKIVSLSYQIRDSQNRWKKIERGWTPSTANFSHTISWNRVFADGIVAPVGNYHVTVYAEDAAGNRSQKSAQIIIPAPNATALPTFTPTATPTNTPLTTPTARTYDAPPLVPTATQIYAEPSRSTPFVFIAPEPTPTEEKSGFFSFFTTPDTPKSASQSSNTQSPILWGTAAAAALGAFNAVIAEKKRKEKARSKNKSDHAKRKAAEKAGKSGAYLRGKRKAKAMLAKAKADRVHRKDQKKKDQKQREKSGLSDNEWKKKQERQAIWDANGAAIYEANKAFETDHGHKMDSASREKAIAEATVGGVFNAGLYSANLGKAQEEKEEKQVAAQQALHEKSFNHKESLLELSDLPEKVGGIGGLFSPAQQDGLPPTAAPDGYKIPLDRIIGEYNLISKLERNSFRGEEILPNKPWQYGNVRKFLQGGSLNEALINKLSSRHTNLCGYITVSAITGIPLKDVLIAYVDDAGIGNNLEENKGIGTTGMVDVFTSQGWSAEVVGQGGNNWESGTPGLGDIGSYLGDGKGVAVWVTINGNEMYGASTANGPLQFNGNTPHWVTVQDVNTVANEIRIYNSFNNQEQIYNYNDFLAAWTDSGANKIDSYVAVVATPPTKAPSSTPTGTSSLQPASTSSPPATEPWDKPLKGMIKLGKKK